LSDSWEIWLKWLSETQLDLNLELPTYGATLHYKVVWVPVNNDTSSHPYLKVGN